MQNPQRGRADYIYWKKIHVLVDPNSETSYCPGLIKFKHTSIRFEIPFFFFFLRCISRGDMWAWVSPRPETSKAEHHYTDSWEQERGLGVTSITHTEGAAAGTLPSQQKTPAAFTTEETNG